MGTAIWLRVRGDASELDDDNVMLLRLEQELAGLADRLKVRPLTDYYDYGALAEQLGDELEAAGVEVPETGDAWFPSDEGLTSFTALEQELRARPDSLGLNATDGREDWTELLMAELTSCARRLTEAVAARRDFRLRLVP